MADSKVSTERKFAFQNVLTTDNKVLRDFLFDLRMPYIINDLVRFGVEFATFCEVPDAHREQFMGALRDAGYVHTASHKYSTRTHGWYVVASKVEPAETFPLEVPDHYWSALVTAIDGIHHLTVHVPLSIGARDDGTGDLHKASDRGLVTIFLADYIAKMTAAGAKVVVAGDYNNLPPSHVDGASRFGEAQMRHMLTAASEAPHDFTGGEATTYKWFPHEEFDCVKEQHLAVLDHVLYAGAGLCVPVATVHQDTSAELYQEMKAVIDKLEGDGADAIKRAFALCDQISTSDHFLVTYDVQQ